MIRARPRSDSEGARPVVVIGAGPAGASMAVRLAQTGVRTTLLDRAVFPRETVCGCCLNQRAVSMLDDLGLGQALDELDARVLDSMTLHAGGRCVSLKLPQGRVLSRSVLDHAILTAAERHGATVRTGVSARVSRVGGADWIGVEAGQEMLRASVVVVADGIHGTALSGHDAYVPRVRAGAYLGVAAHVESNGALGEGELLMCCASDGYVGFVELEDGTIDCAAALDADLIRERGTPSAAVNAIVGDAGGPDVTRGLDGAGWMGTGRLTRARPRVAGRRLFVIGDAASYVEPFTGEGIAWALESAAHAAPLVARAAQAWDPALADDWSRMYRRRVRRRQRGCRIVSAALRQPTFMRGVVGVARRAPWLAGPLAARFAGAARSGRV